MICDNFFIEANLAIIFQQYNDGRVQLEHILEGNVLIFIFPGKEV